jgi:hypothetical protein
VILSTLSGTTFMPALAAASFASFLLTTRVSLIRTQRSRGHLQLSHEYHAPAVARHAVLQEA